VNNGKKTILIVDDVPDDIVILDEILKRDYQVKAVTSGDAALKIARSDNPPDLILLDVIMPEMDGFEVCRRLKQDSRGAMIPVIFLTAKVMAIDEKMGLELGAVDYIRKPIDPEIVRTRITSHLENKDQMLRSSEVRFRRLFETSMDGIMIVDSETGFVVDVNHSMAKIMGITQEQFLGKRVHDFDFLSAILAQRNDFPELGRRRYVRYKDQPMKTVDGRLIYVDFACNSYDVNNREVLQVNIRDISDLVVAEIERDQLASKLSHYLSTSPTVTYSLALKDGAATWLWVSENIKTLLGYGSDEALDPDWWFTNIDSADRMDALGSFMELVKSGASVREYRFRKKDRTVVWLRDELRFVGESEGVAEIVGTLTDISSRRLAEEEALVKSAALEAAANTILIADKHGTVRWVNSAYEALTGYSRADLIGTNPRDGAKSDLLDEAVFEKLWDTIFSGKVWSGELEDRKKSGEPFAEEATVTPVFDGAGKISGFIAILNDITERKRNQARLEALLREKGEFLREIHHRVNNNVQVLMSLLNITAQQIEDAGLRNKLGDVSRRMQTMAIVHHQFYESEDMSRIDFAVFLQQLMDSLASDFPEIAPHVQLRCEHGEAFLSLEQATPAGLIVSELLTNAFKFAFPAGRSAGSILLSQRMVGESLEVEVRDDGIGLPREFDPDKAETLGLILIHILSEQLNGGVKFQSAAGGGTSAVLRFAVKGPYPNVNA
jgi:PAS domain S-box-containing protein